MTNYEIHGAQGFRVTADSAAKAYTLAVAAQRQFPPINITAPDGIISLAELHQRSEQERRDAQGS